MSTQGQNWIVLSPMSATTRTTVTASSPLRSESTKLGRSSDRGRVSVNPSFTSSSLTEYARNGATIVLQMKATPWRSRHAITSTAS